MTISGIKETEKKIAQMDDEELGMLYATIHQELIKREAKKMILRLVDQQK